MPIIAHSVDLINLSLRGRCFGDDVFNRFWQISKYWQRRAHRKAYTQLWLQDTSVHNSRPVNGQLTG